MEALWNNENEEYYINTLIENQTFHMAFQRVAYSLDTVYFNIYMTLYNKKGQIDKNEEHIKLTGLNPWRTAITAKKCFEALELKVLTDYNYKYNIIIYCTWLDNRRRDIYNKFLSKKGYRSGILTIPEEETKQKCIFKKFKKEEIK